VSSVRDRLRAVGERVAAGLESAGIIEASRFRATADLAWPRIVTGFSRMSHTDYCRSLPDRPGAVVRSVR
jgi:hypothetical protein